MSNREEQIEAARDAIECAGELLSYKESGESVGDVYGKITIGAELFDESGLTMRANILRVVKDDAPDLSKSATFTTEAGVIYRYINLASDNGITLVIEIGE